MQRQLLDKHVKSECSFAEVTCPHASFGCRFVASKKDVDVHLQQCPYAQISGLLVRSPMCG